MSLTMYVAEFIAGVRLEAVPPEVQRLARRSILDGVGLALAGHVAESGRLVDEYLRDLGCAGGASTVIGSALRVPPRFAAFANGVAIHADDYDDTQLAVATDRVYGLLMHPTAPVLPAVLALAERDDRSGADLLAAYLAGTEVACKVAEAIDPRHSISTASTPQVTSARSAPLPGPRNCSASTWRRRGGRSPSP